ncbi:uncharacterized protein LOC141620437 [Silene latifolia]|uniref:uncharacterized protein LOC141620437 n=1 Tax=Silene latifolia TaxID=37657 RepID=UPI003D77A3E1
MHSDKLGGSNVIRGQQDFTSWRFENSLLDVPFFGPPFSWFNNRSDGQLIMERLDRAYANNDWLHLFPAASVMHLPILISDHAPIILKFLPNSKSCRRPYRLDNWCFNSPEIANIVDCAWRITISGCPITRILDVESATSFQHVRSTQLQLLQTQHAYWLQRAKLKNDILDGLPSRFLYSRVKQRSSHQHILTLLSGSGEWLFDPDQISLEITSFFQDLLCSTPPQDPGSPRGFIDHLLESLDLPLLSSADCLLLSAPFTELDIIHALNGIDGSKSPGPDGITPKNFQTFWPQIGQLVTMALLRFLNSGVMLKEWNNTHIILIPKVEKPELISQYRPISLCNVIYHLASKCLANQLKLVISSIVSDSQQAFVPSRLMSDGCLITHEIMHYLNKTKKGSVSYAALKLDMHKAFDRVSWPFLIAIMKKFGFPIFWQNIIWEFVSTVTYNILINGEPSSSFRPSCGLRQATPNSFETLRDLFRCFELASGQMINLDKFFIKFSPNTPADFKSHMASILKMRTTDSFGNYLGVLVDLPSTKSLVFQPLLDKMTTRIIAWSSLHLSQPCKLLIINSILLGSIHFLMTSIPFPIGICKNIDSLIAAFWWRKDVRHRSIHWLSRDSLQLPREHGGLGRIYLFLLRSQKSLILPFLWSGLCRTANAFAPGFSWKLGNGSFVDLLTSHWVNGNTPSVRPISAAFSPVISTLLTPSVHNILPSLENLSVRGIQVSTSCVFCHSHSESLDHLFRSCTVARHVWLSSALGINFVANSGVCLQRWIADFIGYFHRVTDTVDRCLLRFLRTIKAIWMGRNSIIFDNCSVNPFQILHMADYLFASHSHLPVLWPSFLKNTNKSSILTLDDALSLSAVTYFILVCRSSPRDRFIVTSSDSISCTPVIQHVRAFSVFAASTKGLLLNMYRAQSASLPSVSFQVTSKKLSSVLAFTKPVPIELRHSLCTIRSFLRRYVHWSVSLATG